MKINNPELFKILPDGILFDLDNTFYNYSEAHHFAHRLLREKVTLDFSVSEEDFDAAHAQAKKEIKANLGTTASSHSRLLYFQRMLEILSFGFQIQYALELEQTYWRNFLLKSELYMDAKEFLDDIRLLGIPSCVVTDLTSQIQFRKILYMGLDNLFDYIVTSEEAGKDKPHLNMFNLAKRKMGPSVEIIWMIGDDLLKDIKGSKETINAITLHKVDNKEFIKLDREYTDLSFETFFELRKLLKKINQ